MASAPDPLRSTRADDPLIDDGFSTVLSSPSIGWSVGRFRKVIKVWNFSSRLQWNKKNVLHTSANGWVFDTPTVVLETWLRQQWLIFEGSLDYQNPEFASQMRGAKACALWSDSITITITSGTFPITKPVAAKFFFPDIPKEFIAS